jgi:hypothetical protein
VKLRMKLVVFAGALALALVPATALAAGQPEDPGSQGQEHAQEHATPGPHATLPEKAKAYGHYCNEESRKHVAGEPGTPFSKCVTAAAKMAADVQDADENDVSPTQACKEESKKHVKGEQGTPFSRCVVAAAQVKEDLEDEGDQS